MGICQKENKASKTFVNNIQKLLHDTPKVDPVCPCHLPSLPPNPQSSSSTYLQHEHTSELIAQQVD